MPNRSSATRTITATTTSGQATLSAASGTFDKSDAGRPISGTGIPAGAKLLSVTSSTAATLSANATASGSVTLTLARDANTDTAYGFFGNSPETAAQADVYSVTGSQASPDRLSNSTTRAVQP